MVQWTFVQSGRQDPKTNPELAQSHAGPTSCDPTRGRRAQSGQNRIWSEADQTGTKPTSIGYSSVRPQLDDL